MSWLSRRKTYRVSPEEGRSGPQLRVSPGPCCGNEKRGGSVTISTATGLWMCFACGRKGNWLGFTRAAGEPIADAYEGAPPVDFAVYEKIRSRLRRPVSDGHHPALLSLCASRGFSRETLDDWRVSTCGPSSLRWPMLALDDAGTWQIANARVRKVIDREAGGTVDWFEVKGGPTCLAIGNHLLGKEPTAWQGKRPAWGDDWLGGSPSAVSSVEAKGDAVSLIRSQTLEIKRVLIVEGQWDAMTAWQLGIPNVLSLPNGAAHVDVAGLCRYVPERAEVWLALDMDEAGDRAAEAFFAQLGSQARRLTLPAKDLNQWLADHPGLTAEEVLGTAEREAPKAPGVVNLLGKTRPVPSEIICETPWSRLTRRLAGGFRAGQTTGLLAPSGSGKTTICNNIVAHAAYRGVPAGIIQLEGLQDEVVLKLTAQLRGWTQPDIEEDFERHLGFLKLSPLSGKKVTLEQTLDAAEDLMTNHGARLVVIDNWDYITPPDGQGHRMKADAYAEFQELCKRHRAHGLVVWQPRKVDRKEAVNSGQQKGMSTAFQDADVYVTVNKFGLTRRLEVEKARVDDGDEADGTVWLRYDRDRSSLFETESQATLTPMEGEKPDDKF